MSLLMSKPLRHPHRHLQAKSFPSHLMALLFAWSNQNSSARDRLTGRVTLMAAVALGLVVILSQISSALSSTAQQTPASNVNYTSQSNSLPGLSERAAGGGLNSRYLSAGSTASLAVATVAAANQQQQQASQSGGANPGHLASGSNQQQQQAHQGQHQQHNQQHQITQQQQQVANAQNSIAQQHSPASALQQQQPSSSQYGPVVVPALAQQQQQQQQQQLQPINGLSTNPPVMSTTHAYNPLIGQYLPNFDQQASNSGSQLGQQQQQQLPLSSNQLQLQAQVPQQSQYNPNAFSAGPNVAQLAQQNTFGFPYQTYSPAKQAQLYQRPYGFPFGYFASNPLQQTTQFSPPGRGSQNIFSRRNGLGFRPQGSYADDLDPSNSLTQQQQNVQQQQQSASLADQLAASLGLNLDPSYSSLPSPSNAYLVQQQNGNQLLDFPGAGGFIGNQQQQVGSLSSQAAAAAGGGGSGLPGGLALDYAGAPAHSPASFGYSRQSDQCVAADGRHGTCYQASECIRRGGTPMGRCSNQLGTSSTGSSDQSHLSGSSSVCCLFDVTCGQFAAERFVYFRNPGYPTSTYDQSRMCRAKIGKLDKGVCQFRLDMLRFDIAKPTNGNCSQDMFVVSGQNENYVIPKICGFNDGQHYYVGVDESGVITLHMMMMGYYRRSFEILITQLPCRSDFAPPAHCLQYFMGTHGTIKSFNYDNDDYNAQQQQQHQALVANQQQQGAGSSFVNYDLQLDGSGQSGAQTAPYGLQFAQSLQQRQGQQQQPMFTAAQQQGAYGSGASQYGGYPNDLDYTICIRKESGFCSITYQLSRGDQGSFSPFAVGQTGLFGGGGHNDTLGWPSVSTECRDDYLLIGGVRLCSGSPGGGGQQGTGFYEPSSFGSQNNTGAVYQQLWQQQQQLSNQRDLIMQQLVRLQQQQQQVAVAGNGSLSNSINGQQQQQQQVGVGNNGGINLEQQQAILSQQLMLVQQQLNGLGAASGGTQQTAFQAPNRYHPADLNSGGGDLQSSIITDTTSGPFLLRFVSNNARNARGFHIDYRQNPCK